MKSNSERNVPAAQAFIVLGALLAGITVLFIVVGFGTAHWFLVVAGAMWGELAASALRAGCIRAVPPGAIFENKERV
jgi:hypothetical protein